MKYDNSVCNGKVSLDDFTKKYFILKCIFSLICLFEIENINFIFQCLNYKKVFKPKLILN